eukprot:598335-Hanusia_phi.AAC.1
MSEHLHVKVPLATISEDTTSEIWIPLYRPSPAGNDERSDDISGGEGREEEEEEEEKGEEEREEKGKRVQEEFGMIQ